MCQKLKLETGLQMLREMTRRYKEKLGKGEKVIGSQEEQILRLQEEGAKLRAELKVVSSCTVLSAV